MYRTSGTVVIRLYEEKYANTTKRKMITRVQHFERGLTFLQNHYSEYIESVLFCMRSRLKPHENPDTDVLNHALKIFATHGCESI